MAALLILVSNAASPLEVPAENKPGLHDNDEENEASKSKEPRTCHRRQSHASSEEGGCNTDVQNNGNDRHQHDHDSE